MIARTTVADNDKSGLIKWTLDCHDGEQTIYRGDDWDAPQGVQSFLGVFELKATLDEVAGLYACHTDDTMAEFRRSVAKNVLDMQQLYVLSAPSDDNPRHFVGIKWAAVASPGMVRHRDWVLLEVNLIDSTLTTPSSIVMKIATIPSSSTDDWNLVRGFQLRSGFVFLEAPHKPGTLHAMQLHQFDLLGNLPSWIVALGIKKRCRAFLNLAKYVRELRLGKTVAAFVPAHEWAVKDLRSHCRGCRKRFLPLVHVKSHCRACGEVFCQHCSKHWSVNLALSYAGHNRTMKEYISGDAPRHTQSMHRGSSNQYGFHRPPSTTTSSYHSSSEAFLGHPNGLVDTNQQRPRNDLIPLADPNDE
ncbi:hypothetical protein DYB35_007353 [Aphanomyces astaci]|uniref:FYVE-type domain-containing protein n=1 Tax=Aphanomyces astaci TaxID=112090 RepID=A0A418DG26_APHAT|nr:hypothetical protein DYB35_007353 [Aphanomyces astaci]